MPTFLTDFTPPSTPGGFEIEADLDGSRMRLTWDASAIAQVDFAGFRVYRSLDLGLNFEVVKILPLVSDTAFDDYEAPLNTIVMYRLTQSNLDFESDPAEGSAALESPMWWVVTPADLTLTFPLTKVRSAVITSAKTQDIYAPIGRPTRVAVGDVVLAEAGELSFIAMPDNLGMVALLRAIQARMEGAIILKAPDGVIHRVQYGDMTRSFTKVGMQEISIPFTGVG